MLTAILKAPSPCNGSGSRARAGYRLSQIAFCGRISQAYRGSRLNERGESETLSSFVNRRDWIEIQTQVPGRR